MHPIMPFLTEEIWQQLPLADPERPDSLMIASWPEPDAEAIDMAAEADMTFLQAVISSARTIRSELNVPQSKKIHLVLAAGSTASAERLETHRDYVQALVGAESIDIGTDLTQPASSGSAVVGDIEIYVPLEGLIDTDAEARRLRKEIDKFLSLITALDKKLGNEGFLKKAPTAVVEKERLRRQEYDTSLQKLTSSLEMLE
jgi:valyl-tRNA synthetase